MRASPIVAALATACAVVPAMAAETIYALEYSRWLGPAGTATATAVVDDTLLSNNGIPQHISVDTTTGFEQLIAFELTIAGTGFIDGTYTLDELTVALSFDAPLDPTQELLAQDTALGPGTDFNLTLSDGGLISAVDVNAFGAEIRDVDGRLLERVWFRLVSVTPVITGADTDGDAVLDDADNCLAHVNPSQTDTDGDGFGNACDADFNQDCVVNFGDLAAMKANFITGAELTDLNDDGQTNFADLALFKALFLAAPGPSGVANACGLT